MSCCQLTTINSASQTAKASETNDAIKYNLHIKEIKNTIEKTETTNSKISFHSVSICALFISKLKKHTLKPKRLSDLNCDTFNVFHGGNRQVYINKKTHHGYKIPKNLASCDKFSHLDLRLNDLYRNDSFYGGKYSSHANFSVTELSGEDGKKYAIPTFKAIDKYQILSSNEKIPRTCIEMIEASGFSFIDVKPGNFIKVKNETKGYDYLPIEAKFMSLNRSNSSRSKIFKF